MIAITNIHSRRGIAAPILLASALLLALLMLLSAVATSVEAQSTIIYVDVAASGTANGSSWDNAYASLQDALSVAADGDEIWVATGVYTPGASVNDSFNIPPGVAVYGGFAGDETERGQRDWEANSTVLSGDLDSDDVTDAHGVVTDTIYIVGDNAFRVVVLDGTTTPITASTRLDGVIITAGHAIGSSPENAGGGLFCNGEGADSKCSPTLTNVTFRGNWAHRGGAMYNEGGNSGESRPALTNVTFAGNAARNGGAMFNHSFNNGISSPTLISVTFTGNWATDNGGAMFNNGYYNGISSPTLTNVTLAGNQAFVSGGAMYNNGLNGESNPILTNVTFAGNSVIGNGGAMYNEGGNSGESRPALTNVTFAGNSATSNGAAMYNDGENGESSPTLTNVTFAGNSAGKSGGVMYNYGFLGQSSPLLINVILWHNSASVSGDVMYNLDATPTIAHSLVQGGWDGSGIVNFSRSSVTDGGGNIDADPLFVIPVHPADAPTTTGDLQLQADSPAIDAGDNSALPAGVTTDLAGNPRLMGDAVDMGAYEFQLPDVVPPEEYGIYLPLLTMP